MPLTSHPFQRTHFSLIPISQRVCVCERGIERVCVRVEENMCTRVCVCALLNYNENDPYFM